MIILGFILHELKGNEKTSTICVSAKLKKEPQRGVKIIIIPTDLVNLTPSG